MVALVVWDKTRAPIELIAPKAGWEGGQAAVKAAAEAPPSLDVHAPGKPLEIIEEEERSAANERLYQGLEEEKKRMGIVKIIDKDAEAAPRGRSPGDSAVKAIALKSSEALQTAWAAAGLPGEPPTIDFPKQMAVFLAGPPGCGIVTIQNRKKFVAVLYKDAGFDDASARVRAITPSPKPIVLKLAP